MPRRVPNYHRSSGGGLLPVTVQSPNERLRTASPGPNEGDDGDRRLSRPSATGSVRRPELGEFVPRGRRQTTTGRSAEPSTAVRGVQRDSRSSTRWEGRFRASLLLQGDAPRPPMNSRRAHPVRSRPPLYTIGSVDPHRDQAGAHRRRSWSGASLLRRQRRVVARMFDNWLVMLYVRDAIATRVPLTACPSGSVLCAKRVAPGDESISQHRRKR